MTSFPKICLHFLPVVPPAVPGWKWLWSIQRCEIEIDLCNFGQSLEITMAKRYVVRNLSIILLRGEFFLIMYFSSSSDNSYLLSNPRRIVGLFKIATRMISRNQLSEPILRLLSELLIGKRQSTNLETEDNRGQIPLAEYDDSSSDFVGCNGPMDTVMISQLSAQVWIFKIKQCG